MIQNVAIYPIRPYHWYNLSNALHQRDSKLNAGRWIAKKGLFAPDPSHRGDAKMTFDSILELARHLHSELASRDSVKNEFHKFALSKGSFKDQFSALTLRVDQFALTRLQHIDSLIETLSSDTKRHSAVLIPTLMDLFIDSKPAQNHIAAWKPEEELKLKLGEMSKKQIRQRRESLYRERDRGLLPSDRPLMTFNQRLESVQGDDAVYKVSQMDLILWYFEHLLKKKYTKFIQIVDYYASESAVQKVKYMATRALGKLLQSKPEGEHYILQCVIQKFGQNDKDNVRRITDWLHKTSTKHPLMKPELIREVNDYLNRPNLSPRGMWCAIAFLTKLKFTSLENEAATLLCGVYMDLFRQLIAYQNVFDELSRSETTSRSTITRKAPGSLDAEVIQRVLGQTALHSDAQKQSQNGKESANPSNGNEGKASNVGMTRKQRRKLKGKRKKQKHKKKNGGNTSSDPVSLMKSLLNLTDTTRKKYFKKHPKELALWTRFTQFQAITSKLLAVVLRGMAYVFPFAKLDLEVFKKDLDYIYRLALRAPIKVAVIALRFTFRVETFRNVSSGTNITDLTSTKMIKHSKTRKVDVLKDLITPSDRFYQVMYAICSRWDFITYVDAGFLFNMIYRCIQLDSDKPRITSFVRRFLQFCTCGSVSWVCGALYLISAILRIHPFLEVLMEHTISALLKMVPGHHHKKEKSTKHVAEYNLYETNPKLAKGTQCPMWELTLLTKHMHPAVRNFAKQLLRDYTISYRGDPLRDFDQKVLFEKFSRMLAHQKGALKPKSKKGSKVHDCKQQFVESYADGDGFIAMYKRYGGRSRGHNEWDEEAETEKVDHFVADSITGPDDKEEKRKSKKKKKRVRLNPDEAVHIDESNSKTLDGMENAVSSWLEKTYGGELPDDEMGGGDDDDGMDYNQLQALAQREMEKIENNGSNKQIKDRMKAEEEADDVEVYMGDEEDSDGGIGEKVTVDEFMEMARIEEQEAVEKELDDDEYLRQNIKELEDSRVGYTVEETREMAKSLLKKEMLQTMEMEVPSDFEYSDEDSGYPESDEYFDDLRDLDENGNLPDEANVDMEEETTNAFLDGDDEADDSDDIPFTFGYEEEDGAVDDDTMDFFAEEGKAAGEVDLDDYE